MPVVTRSMKVKMDHDDKAAVPDPSTPINKLPPEVLEMILKYLDCGGNSMLTNRLVHPSWRTIIDDLLEKKSLKTEVVACPTIYIIDSDGESMIRCRQPILRHTGNPFPSKSLRLTGSWGGDQRQSKINLVAFTSTFGTHLTTFILDQVCLDTETLFGILSHLSNLKTLKMLRTMLADLNYDDTVESLRLPPLPNLTSLVLNPHSVVCWFRGNVHSTFYTQVIDAYAGHLVSLEMRLSTPDLETLLQRHPSSSDDCASFQNLRHLKVFYPNVAFFRLSCSPPLQRISVVGLTMDIEMSLGVVMQFVDKFSNTLETLELDAEWRRLFNRRFVRYRWNREDGEDGNIERFYDPGKEDEDANKTGGKLSTAAVLFPKLMKFTVPFPSNDLESAVISKTFLVKFPALKELKLGHYRRAYLDQTYSLVGFEETHGTKIKEFLAREDYWNFCSKLNRISVWLTGESVNPPNYLLHSTCRGDEDKVIM